MTYVFKGHVKIAKTYMVKYTKYIHKYNVILSKTVTKLVTTLTNAFFFSIFEPDELP